MSHRAWITNHYYCSGEAYKNCICDASGNLQEGGKLYNLYYDDPYDYDNEERLPLPEYKKPDPDKLAFYRDGKACKALHP